MSISTQNCKLKPNLTVKKKVVYHKKRKKNEIIIKEYIFKKGKFIQKSIKTFKIIITNNIQQQIIHFVITLCIYCLYAKLYLY